MLNLHYKRALGWALGVHGLLIALVLLMSVVRGCACSRSTRMEVQPIEFLVELPGDEPETLSLREPPEEVVPDPPLDEPAPEAPPEKIPDPEPEVAKPRREPIEVSRKRVVRGDPPPDRKPALDPEELRRRLLEGAEVSDRTTDPDEDARGMARVRAVLFAAWMQPPEQGVRPAKVEVIFGEDGSLRDYKLLESSGDALYDASVMRALGSVRRISGLSAGFLRRHPRLTVEFTLR